MKGRVQVKKLSENSEPLQRQRGVPQGSFLGPNLHTGDHPAIDAINSDLLNIHKWSESNDLALNESKCIVLHIVVQELVRTLSETFVQVMPGAECLLVSDKI
ncbi:hypothetical protein J6590_067851 [Homalodisca vitripennis]|nr:hypothetical protein J6590_067851 [Homalodisca vitripennis]